jgi:hypothetical protein
MLARYRIIRGKRPPGDRLPEGTRIDVRKHRDHALSPRGASVEAFLEDPTEEAARRFAAGYSALLEQRFAECRAPFDELAEAARGGDVYIGCNCPTRKNPDISRCHTVLALRFMKRKYPTLRVVLPRERRGQ